MNWIFKLSLMLIASFIPYSIKKKFNILSLGKRDLVQTERYVLRYLNFLSADLKEKYLSEDEGLNILEFGPGENIFLSVHAWKHNNKVFFLDDGNYINFDFEMIIDFAKLIEMPTEKLNKLENIKNFDDLMYLTGCCFLSNGTQDLNFLKNNGYFFDLIFSTSVLEHVNKEDLQSVLDIFGEIAAQEQLHLVDFRDHITGFLNSHRIPQKIWHSFLFRKAQFHTNRILLPELISFFRKNSTRIEIPFFDTWKEEDLKYLKHISKKDERNFYRYAMIKVIKTS